MPSNYQAICEENRLRYGTDIGRIGPMLLADRYDDRTHFIFELLQNAEDALKRRGEWSGLRRVTFTLTKEALTLSHFGLPFDEADVRGICGIAESTKGVNSIGRFGIGFKSVYTFTDRPEIHSGTEGFAVENYVQPKDVRAKARGNDETLIVLPLKGGDDTAHEEIVDGFRRLGADALLFLRYIEEINWSVEDGPSGVYLRSAPEVLAPNVQRVTVIGQESGQPEVDQVWLVFSREVFTKEEQTAGLVEVAFSLVPVKDKPGNWSVQPVAASPLVVFFPTVVSTNLGFLVQGPYRTTPSRDNVPRHDPWNQHLVRETSQVLIEALRWMRDEQMLDTSTLRCLPLDREKFSEKSMFQPLFEAVRHALMRETLLPSHGSGYVSAVQAKLARTNELRELISPSQVTALFGEPAVDWLTGDITHDRASEIRQYLIHELLIAEITPTSLVPRLTKAFLEAQPDDWILRLYEFLSKQEAALRRRLDTVPLIRLVNGSHVVAKEKGKALAFLPSKIATDFPTVRPSVCSTSEARSFLLTLGITEPDPVDDVIWNVLPKYQTDQDELDVEEHYDSDIDRILKAFNTDSKIQREKLLNELKKTPFVMAADAGSGPGWIQPPGELYIATDRLKSLFAGVTGILLVDDEYECLRGEAIRELLEACGAVRYPRPIPATSQLDREARRQLRIGAGHEESSGINDKVEDWDLKGLEELLATLPNLNPEERKNRARLLWESLGDLEERRSQGIFDGLYSWTHHGSYKAGFTAYFVRRLNQAPWIPDEQGELQPPGFVIFDSLGWKAKPFLLTKIAFKPPIIEQLAKEAGLDPALLDLLKKHGITSGAELINRLGITEISEDDESCTDDDEDNDSGDDGHSGTDVYGDNEDLYGGLPPIQPGTLDPTGGDDLPAGGTGGSTGGGGKGGTRGGGGGKEPGPGGKKPGGSKGPGPDGGKHPGGGNGARTFISYVGTHQDEEEPDPDGLEKQARMQLEELAITKILAEEPRLNRTPANNPGFDLFEKDEAGQTIRWVEVKAMTGTLADRPVTLSYTQFVWGQEHRTAFWLYIVERAGTKDARILRVQDPVGRAKTFTFDRGWEEIARTVPVL